MQRRRFRAHQFILMMIALCLSGVGAAADDRKNPAYAGQELLIQFKPKLGGPHLEAFNRQFKTDAKNVRDAVKAFHRHYRTRLRAEPVPGWQRVQLPPDLEPKQAAKMFLENPAVAKAEPNYLAFAVALSTTYTAVGSLNDPHYTDGQTQWWLSRTKADAAHDAWFALTGPGDVIVAVVDTGVDLDHPELAGRLVAGYHVITPTSQPDDDNQWLGSIQVNGHGTHVAGMIAANANNSQGVAGSAWDSRVKVMPVKVLDYTGYGTVADIAAGITWAAGHGAQVINCSLGTYAYSAALEDACANAIAGGALIVAAAGNDGLNLRLVPIFPACFPNVVAVAAVDSQDQVTAYSNFSDSNGVACTAPGGALGAYTDTTAGLPGVLRDLDFGVTSTANTGGWSAVDGTSFAAPQVSALAALLWLQVSSRSNSEVAWTILTHCEFNPYNSAARQGYGRINYLEALAAYKTPTPTLTITMTATESSTITATPTHTATTTISPTATATPTHTASPTATPTSSPAATATETGTATASPTATPSASPTRTATETGTRTPSPTPTASATGTWTGTATASATGTATASPTATATDTAMATVTPGGPTLTATASATASPTATPSFTATPTPTPTRTGTATASATGTATASPTATATDTAMATVTPGGPTLTATATTTASRTATPSGTSTPTATRTRTATVMETATATASASATPTSSPILTATATAVFYSPTATVTALATQGATPLAGDLSRVLAYPNPWRRENANGRLRIVFLNLPADSRVEIYTLDGRQVASLAVRGNSGRLEWSLANQSGEAAASGVYIYRVVDPQGRSRTGKIALIR